MAQSRAREAARTRWRLMIHRCTNPRRNNYDRYGGRGITVCQEWLDSFDAFYAHVGDPPFKGASIDRIDNDGPYAPWNVRWATASEQAQNRRPRKILKTHCPHGHPYDDQNTIWAAGGERRCRTCKRERDRKAYAWQGGVKHAERTHCPQGHPYDEANTYRDPKRGNRACKECRRAATRRPPK